MFTSNNAKMVIKKPGLMPNLNIIPLVSCSQTYQIEMSHFKHQIKLPFRVLTGTVMISSLK